MIFKRSFAGCVLVCVWVVVPYLFVQAKSIPKLQRLTEALSHPSFKVRLQAAILIGKQRLVKAAPALRKALNDRHDAVKAAAILSLAKLGDGTARRSIAMMLAHKNVLISKSAEKALILLDKTERFPPTYLVAIGKPHLAQSVEASKGFRMMRRLSSKLEDVSGVVLERGEVDVLQGEKLKEHLVKRQLIGIMLQPKLVKLTTRNRHGRTSVFAKASILVILLQNNRLEYDASGEANAWVEGSRISKSERIDMENTVLDASLDAAVDQVLSYLAKRED